MSLQVNEDNTDAWLKAFSGALGVGLEEVGLVAEGYAKKKCPVDTGRLRSSITHVVTIGGEGFGAYIGTNVEYARYVEFGTCQMKAQPYLRPAANDHGAKYRAILEKHLKSGK